MIELPQTVDEVRAMAARIAPLSRMSYAELVVALVETDEAQDAAEDDERPTERGSLLS